MYAWRHPINADSDALKDGRSEPPPPPEEVLDLIITQNINTALGTHLTPWELDDLPEYEYHRLALFAGMTARH